MAQTRFEKLKDAIKTYGAAAFENLMRCRGLSDAIIEGLPDYLQCDKDCVKAVPPIGPIDPLKEYGDEAFSFSRRPVIILEPIRFGVALTVRNLEDSGSLWLRTALSVEVTGDSFDIFVAQQGIIRTPLDFSDKLDPVFEAIYQEYLNTFKLEILEFADKRFETGIGFIPEK